MNKYSVIFFAFMFCCSFAGYQSYIFFTSSENENWKNFGDYCVLDANSVNSILEHDSKLYIGGKISSLGSVSVNNIAMWDGSSWQKLGLGLSQTVNDIIILQDTIYATGVFNFTGSNTLNGIGKWDGSEWLPLGSGLGSGLGNNGVEMAVLNNELYVIHGNFLKKWNGSSWSTIGVTDGSISTLNVLGNDIYIGGRFEEVDGVNASYIAKWDGTSWSAVGTTLTFWVNSLTNDGSTLYAAGWFDNGLAAWDGSSWSYPRGVTDESFDMVRYVNGDLYVYGNYFDPPFIKDFFLKWDGSTWTDLYEDLNSDINDVASFDSELLIGGLFNDNSQPYPNYLAKREDSAWKSFCTDKFGLDGTVSAISTYDDTIHIGGSFNTGASTAQLNFIAKGNGNDWWRVGQYGMNGDVSALHTFGGDLYAGGYFNQADFNSANSIAKWNGSVWSSMDSGTDGGVITITDHEGSIYIGGDFASASGSSVNSIAKWNGVSWEALGLGMSDDFFFFPYVNDILSYNGELVAGGSFTHAGGISASSIAVWDGSSWDQLGGGVKSKFAFDIPVVNALIEFEGDLIVGGDFDSVGVLEVNNIARWDGSSWSKMDEGFSGSITELAIHEGQLYAGGQFSEFFGGDPNYIAKWNGTKWDSLGSGANSSIYSLHSKGDSLWVGGAFTEVGNKTSNRIGIWDFDPCSADTENPMAQCMDIAVNLEEDGTAMIVAEDVNDNSTDNCGIALYSLDQDAFSCADLGTVTIQLTVTDNSGNMHDCSATITVNEGDAVCGTYPCNDSLVITTAKINSGMIEKHSFTTFYIRSNAQIAMNDTFNFYSEGFINFEPDFEIGLGAVFKADIRDCPE